MEKPFSPSADRNKDAILSVLSDELSANQFVLEIGSGTGQHACFFTAELPDVTWQPTDLEPNISAIESWISELEAHHILAPIVLDVNNHPWPITQAHVCFTSNTFHIVSIDAVRSIFRGCRAALKGGGKLVVYGPFSMQGKHTSPGNEQFDKQLRASNPESGIRDCTELNTMAKQFGFNDYRRIEMPANNLVLVWEIGSQQS